MGKKRQKKVFEDLEIVDAGAKGKSIAFAPDGKVVFVNNAVPGDVCTIQTTKRRKSFYE